MSLPYGSRQSRFTSFDNFQKFISTKKVLCKCGETVSLGAIYQVANFQRHFQSKNCDYYLNKQPSINVFFSNSISENDEENRNDEGSNDERNRKRIACEELKGNKRLDEALKAERATSSTVKFIHRHYYKQPLLELLKISNLRQFWAATNSKSDDAEFWIKVAQFGLSGEHLVEIKLLLNLCP
ncbi:unnamed protein product [Rhizophagus irregularis]|nr:unnamed protein product [Rhizophagus irregularis]